MSSSQLLEDFLDFHGAKNSHDWYFYRELSAAVWHLSLCRLFPDVISRTGLPFYRSFGYGRVQKEGRCHPGFLDRDPAQAGPGDPGRSRRLGIPVPEEACTPQIFPGVTTTDETLPFDIDDVNQDQQKKHIVNIASEFLNIAKKFDEISFFEPYSPEMLRAHGSRQKSTKWKCGASKCWCTISSPPSTPM